VAVVYNDYSKQINTVRISIHASFEQFTDGEEDDASGEERT
jgi:hypothetical protein